MCASNRIGKRQTQANTGAAACLTFFPLRRTFNNMLLKFGEDSPSIIAENELDILANLLKADPENIVTDSKFNRVIDQSANHPLKQFAEQYVLLLWPATRVYVLLTKGARPGKRKG